VENPHKKNIQRNDKGKAKTLSRSSSRKIQDTCSPTRKNEEKKMEDGGDTIMQLDEQDLADIDLEKLEEAFNKKELQSIPVEN
jgi:hypothetical protein